MVIIGILLIVLFGYGLANLLILKGELFEKICLGYILGIGIFTFVWFLLNLVKIPYTLLSGSVLLIILNIIVFILNRLKFGRYFGNVNLSFKYFMKLNTLEKVILGIIGFLCLSALIQNLYWPVMYWDSLVLYDFRAKLFADTGFMMAAITRGYFFGYPLLTSLSHTWVYLLSGINPSFLYGLFYLGFVFVMFFNFKKLNLNRSFVLLLTLIVAISPRLFDHTQWAYTNLPYTIYLVLGSIYLYFGVRKKDLGIFVISALLVGLSTWTRSAEPFWLSCVVMAVVSSLFIKKWLWPLVYTTTVGLLMLPWRLFQSAYNEGSANVANQVVSTTSSVVQNLQMAIIKPTFNFFVTNVINMYLVYFILLGIVVLIKLFTKSKEWFFTVLIFFDLALAFAGTLIFVRYTPYWQDIPDSLARMVMFIPPMIIFLTSELLYEVKTR